MENKSVCEEIEIALYSDAELTDEQKEHIENCESCRALLSEINKMKADLGSLSVPGISEGQITKSVMESLAKENTPVPFPKFKLTHHLGTAAAIVIILAAVLIMKNPTEPDFKGADGNEAVTFTEPVQKNSHILTGAVKNDGQTADGGLSQFADISDETTVLYDSSEEKEEGVIMRSAYVPDEDAEFNNAADDVCNYSAQLSSAAYEPDMQAEEVLTEAETEAPKTAAEESKKLMMSAPVSNASCGSGSSNNSNAAAADKQAPYEEAEAETSQDSASEITEAYYSNNAYADNEQVENEDDVCDAGLFSANSTAKYIFEGIDFSANDWDFEYNISLANKRLYELYGSEYVLSPQKLTQLGVNNKKLLELAPTITDEMFNFYSGILDIFE